MTDVIGNYKKVYGYNLFNCFSCSASVLSMCNIPNKMLAVIHIIYIDNKLSLVNHIRTGSSP